MAGTEIDFGRWDEASASFEGRGQGGTGDIRYFRDPETGYYYAAIDTTYKGRKRGIGQSSKLGSRRTKTRTDYIRISEEELEEYKRFARGKNNTAWRGRLGKDEYAGPGSMSDDYGAMFKKLRDQQEEASADYSTGSRGAKRKQMLLSAANVTEAYRDAYMQQGWGGAQRGRR